MRLHLSSIRDYATYYLDNEYIEVPRPMIVELMKEKEHNQMMIELVEPLSYVEFDDVKECITTKKVGQAGKNPWRRQKCIDGKDKELERKLV